MLIKFTHLYTNQPVYFNPVHISAVRMDEGNAFIALVGETMATPVKESEDEVIAKLYTTKGSYVIPGDNSFERL